MKIVCMTGGVKEVIASNVSDTVIMLTRAVPDVINMVSELSGESEEFKKIARHSKANKLIVVMLFRAIVYKKQYLSCLVVDNGKILGVSDMTHRVSGEMLLDRGQSYRIYDTTLGCLGVIIGDDIFFPEVARTERLAGAKTFVYISPFRMDNTTTVAVKAASLYNGVNTVYIAADESGVVGLYGNILYRDTDFYAFYDIEEQCDDRLIRGRRTEIYQDVFINDQTP